MKKIPESWYGETHVRDQEKAGLYSEEQVPVPFSVNLLEINPLFLNSAVSGEEKHVAVRAP